MVPTLVENFQYISTLVLFKTQKLLLKPKKLNLISHIIIHLSHAYMVKECACTQHSKIPINIMCQRNVTILRYFKQGKYYK